MWGTQTFNIERDTKLFNNALEDIFNNLDGHNKGIIINGERLNNLRVADDIVLISDNLEDLHKIHISKTKVISNSNTITPIVTENQKEIDRIQH